MSAQENKAIARQFCEETWGKGNLAALDELASCDFKVYYSILPAPLDRESFKSWVAMAALQAKSAIARVSFWDGNQDGTQHQARP